MSNVKIQMSNQIQSPNVKKSLNLTFNHYALIWHLTFSIGIFILDRISKLLSIHYLEPLRQPAPTFGLRLFLNPTFAFGIPGGNRLAIILSTVVILVLIRHIVLKLTQETYKLQATSYALIIAGAFGNLFDRLTHGATIDWIVAGPWTINLADIAIVLGVLMLLFKKPNLNT